MTKTNGERKFLAMGRTGQVLLDIPTKRVIKLPLYPNDEDYIAYLLNEIACYKKLDAAPHSCVLRFLGYNDSTGAPSLSLPYIETGDLWNYLRGDGKGTINSRRLKWSRQVTMAVCHLHHIHIYHGDLRPVNILVDANQNLLVCDFDAALVGIPGRVFVTPQYSIKPFCRRTCLSLEELAEVDRLCLASVLYFISTGMDPFATFKNDDEWISNYEQGIFPDTSGEPLGDIILGTWREEITDAKEILFRIDSYVDYLDRLEASPIG
ncbi:kinase-like protein [Calocera viscosa TUFC12733]|uniref:Kinase-like protein n=1 Tax=Calocera viscosa (strain TUFC12733) TaxID=1330018 RepID=A0A167GGX9_CALVF|nr:kinase-like protein [Calocera viscosa TUFC12733]